MTERYRSWDIYPNDFRGHPSVDWVACHQDFDGAEDAHDTRCFAGPSPEVLRTEIDEWELTHPERVYDRTWVECPSCLGEGSVLVCPLNG